MRVSILCWARSEGVTSVWNAKWTCMVSSSLENGTAARLISAVVVRPRAAAGAKQRVVTWESPLRTPRNDSGCSWPTQVSWEWSAKQRMSSSWLLAGFSHQCKQGAKHGQGQRPWTQQNQKCLGKCPVCKAVWRSLAQASFALEDSTAARNPSQSVPAIVQDQILTAPQAGWSRTARTSRRGQRCRSRKSRTQCQSHKQVALCS